MQSAALMWLMYDHTGDPRWPSWLLVAQVGPTLLLGTWGGSLADRRPKRQLVFTTQCAFLLNAIVLTAVVASGAVAPWLVLTLMFVNGAIQAVDLPARLAFVPDLVPKEDLINAVGLNSLLFNSARAVGPALAGVLFLLADAVTPLLPAGLHAVTLAATMCFALNSVSFLAVLFALRGIPEPAAHEKKPEGNSAWEGFRYLREQPALGGLVAITFVVCVFGWPVLTMLPAYTRIQLGLKEDAYSWLLSSLGAGALSAALATATFGSVGRRGTFLLVGVAASGMGVTGLALAVRLWLAAGCCILLGFGMILFLATAQSTLQLAVPDDKRGRVMALWAMTLSGSAPLGHLLAGQAVTEFGIGPVLFAMALGLVVAIAALAVMLAVHPTKPRPSGSE